MNADHLHACATCSKIWACVDYTEKECRSKGVFKAIQVNGQGPYCTECLEREMARRVSDWNAGKVGKTGEATFPTYLTDWCLNRLCIIRARFYNHIADAGNMVLYVSAQRSIQQGRA